jgi:hypothetical protein
MKLRAHGADSSGVITKPAWHVCLQMTRCWQWDSNWATTDVVHGDALTQERGIAGKVANPLAERQSH